MKKVFAYTVNNKTYILLTSAKITMPQSFKHCTKRTTSSSSVAHNWQNLIRNAIRPAVQSQTRDTHGQHSTDRHKQGGGTDHNSVDSKWFMSVSELQQKKKKNTSTKTDETEAHHQDEDKKQTRKI